MSSELRPENAELDATQMADLQDFFSKRSKEEIENDLEQLIKDMENDKGPYALGGTPANVAKAYLTIREIIDKNRGEE